MCEQIFATDFHLSCSFPMKLKSEAHGALPLLFQQDRVMSSIICDNAKDMILGEFSRKLKEASCHLRQTDPFTPLSNAAESEIKKLKKGSGGKLMNLVLQINFGMIA